MIFGKQENAFCLPFFIVRGIMKKSVFHVSGENASAGRENAFSFFEKN